MTAADQWCDQIEIRSESSSRVYIVSRKVGTDTWGCSCPGWKGYGRCKHLRAMGKQSCRAPSQPAPRGMGTGDNSAFQDDAFSHYDASHGFGTWREWVRQAEKQARGREHYREYVPPRRDEKSFYDAKQEAMKLLGLFVMPNDAADLARAYRRAAMRTHPDRDGGSHEAFIAVNQAYERLLRYYPKEAAA